MVVRYTTKIAYYNELKGQRPAALMSYQQAYMMLKDVKDQLTLGVQIGMDEVKSMAGLLMTKVRARACACVCVLARVCACAHVQYALRTQAGKFLVVGFFLGAKVPLIRFVAGPCLAFCRDFPVQPTRFASCYLQTRRPAILFAFSANTSTSTVQKRGSKRCCFYTVHGLQPSTLSLHDVLRTQHPLHSHTTLTLDDCASHSAAQLA